MKSGQTAPHVTQTAVMVIFQRGDSETLFNDPKLVATLSDLNMAEMFAYECDASSFPDLQADATKGPGRALFQALNQLAETTEHPELSSANVILWGFSAAGYLSVSMTSAYPQRVLGAIPYAPASEYYNLDNVPVSPDAAHVPMLILGSATDLAAGTQRPMNLFLRGWSQNGRWGFGVQNLLNHCCADSTANVTMPWVKAIAQQQSTTSTTGQLVLKASTTPPPPTVRFTCSPDGLFDAIGWQDCAFTGASILPSTTGGQQAGWLPDVDSANAWLTWVTKAGGN